ncbi:uncharacterized protein LOC108268498 [Ictalurus punctatus]|uniref:Uncharacterized protein LOC108268498 n=1 Tax=Ictalurus punctatus TaxID=7998 RepID=A0A2D0REP2_ICTPU|nr:uncharacterized protein LOC108268498 [Ictalurus punctatus]XP_017329012.3 uncharacterized protein LOC108268498 [Ictalurus punctatus]
MTVLEQLEVQKSNTSGNAQVEHLHKLQAPAPPTVPRRGRKLLPAQQERLERIKAHQPNINTPCGTRWVTEYTENFGLPQPVRLTPEKTAHWKASIFYSTRNPHSADKCRHTEYQALYSPETDQCLQTDQCSQTDQCLPPPLGKATARHCPKASTLRGAPPTASTKALPGRKLLPAQQERLERIKAHQPDINTPCGTRWVTKYTENVGSPQIVRLPRAPKKTACRLASTFRSIPNPHFGDKYRRSEYQAIYGPEIRTAQFNLTLYRQLHGTA